MTEIVVHVHAWGCPFYVGTDQHGKTGTGTEWELKEITRFPSEAASLAAVQEIVDAEGRSEGLVVSLLPSDQWNNPGFTNQTEPIHVQPTAA